MTITIQLYPNDRPPVFKNLLTELKKKYPIKTKKDAFGTNVKFNVTSFDEIISLLEKYNSEINIELSIYPIGDVHLYIHIRNPWSGLDEQVE